MYAKSIAMAVGFAVAGGAVGWAYFSLLRRSVEQRVGRPSGGRFVLLAIARAALFAACLAPAFWLGTWPVIGYMAGFVVARTVLVARARREIVEMNGNEREAPAES